MMKRAILVMVILMGISLVKAEISQEYLCNKIHALNNSQMVVNSIKNETGEVIDVYLIDYYKKNEGICRKVIAVINDSKILCDKIYWFIVNNQYNYTNNDLTDLAYQSNVSIEVLKNYRYNYHILCLNSSKLPIRNLPVLEVKQINSCNIDTPLLFEGSIPFFKIELNSCDSINILKYFFNIEKEDYYKISGIRPIVLIFLGFLIFIYQFTKSDKLIQKTYRRIHEH